MRAPREAERGDGPQTALPSGVETLPLPVAGGLGGEGGAQGFHLQKHQPADDCTSSPSPSWCFPLVTVVNGVGGQGMPEG